LEGIENESDIFSEKERERKERENERKKGRSKKPGKKRRREREKRGVSEEGGKIESNGGGEERGIPANLGGPSFPNDRELCPKNRPSSNSAGWDSL
jgi:hypothetical protein